VAVTGRDDRTAETAAPYPPGIPALAPGELVTRELLDQLREIAALGGCVAYCSDPTLETLLVVREEAQPKSPPTSRPVAARKSPPTSRQL
jgi:lysine decarboxylase